MKKRWLFLLIPLALLACRALSPIGAIPTPTMTSTTTPPTATSTAKPTTTSTLTPTTTHAMTPTLTLTAFASGPDFTLARLHPKDGALPDLLAAEVQKAQALGQTPFVEFDATWCPPCRAIAASLTAQNPLMLKAYRGVYLIHLDVDEWGNSAPSFSVKAIPVFFRLDQDGKPTGATVDGGAWQEDIPENMAPVLTKFFHP